MSVADAALYAATYWSRDDAIIMVAIAAAESGGQNDAPGDHIDFLACYNWRNVVGRGPCSGDAYALFLAGYWATYGPYACNGYTSFGLWQINTRWHHDKLERHTGSTDPCVWAQNLIDPHFNAVLAHEVWEAQGFGAWTMYNTGDYRRFLDDAARAVDEALGILKPPPVLPWPPELYLPYAFSVLPPVDPSAAPNSLFPDVAPVEPPPGFH